MFIQKWAPRPAGLLNAPIGTLTPLHALTEAEIKGWYEEKPTVSQRPTYELDLHSGHAICVGRDSVAYDDISGRSLSIFSVRGDAHLALDY
jgi:hypothetical protein